MRNHILPLSAGCGSLLLYQQVIERNVAQQGVNPLTWHQNVTSFSTDQHSVLADQIL